MKNLKVAAIVQEISSISQVPSALFFLTSSLLLFLSSCQNLSEKNLPSPGVTVTPIADLPSALAESSGLEYQNGKLWTHNDSGDAPNLYRIDSKTGEILTTKEVTNAVHVDWEDAAATPTHLFVGDFGNNLGNRKDLRIYRVNTAVLTVDTVLQTEIIDFSYLDQPGFIFQKEQHDYNGEALIAAGDSLYIFSKSHLARDTRVYALPQKAGRYSSASYRNFGVKGLITAADFDEKNQVLYLLGYEESLFGFKSFVWRFSDFPAFDFFAGKAERFELGINEQTEGITVDENGALLLTSEREGLSGGRLYRVDLPALKQQ